MRAAENGRRGGVGGGRPLGMRLVLLVGGDVGQHAMGRFESRQAGFAADARFASGANAVDEIAMFFGDRVFRGGFDFFLGQERFEAAIGRRRLARRRCFRRRECGAVGNAGSFYNRRTPRVEIDFNLGVGGPNLHVPPRPMADARRG